MGDPSYALAIDLGTSGPKVALVSARGEVVADAFSPVELLLLPDGGAEQDPAAWWEAIGTAARRVLAAAPVPATRVGAVCVTGQWSGTVAVDGRGEPVGNAIIWMDSRGARYVPALVGGPVRIQGFAPGKLRRWLRLTGGAPSGSGKDPIAHILYLRHERPEVYRAAETFLEPKDFVNLLLTGRAAASFDSIALHWLTDNRDPRRVEYDPALLRLAGLERSRVPDLHPATAVLGGLTATAAAHLALPAGTPVVAGTPDVHSAAIGAGTTRDFAAHLYIGTSAWITCHVPFKKTDLLHSIASLPAAVPGRYLVADEQETAGKTLDWLAGILFPDGDGDVHDRLNEIAAAAPPGAGGVVFTPWLYGERTPVEDATLRASFFAQSLATGRAEMVRAVFEGVALNARWLLGYVERFTGRRLDPIVMVGGGAVSDLWCQIHADVLDRTILQAADPILVNVRGAGMLAHAALGQVAWDEVDDLVPVAASYAPDARNRSVYDRAYEAFRRFHKATRRLSRWLDR